MREKRIRFAGQMILKSMILTLWLDMPKDTDGMSKIHLELNIGDVVS